MCSNVIRELVSGDPPWGRHGDEHIAAKSDADIASHLNREGMVKEAEI
jgi:hypothetical protein